MLPMVDYMDSDHETVVEQRNSEQRIGDSVNPSFDLETQPKDLKGLLSRYLAWPFPEEIQKRPAEHIAEPIDIKILVNITGTEPNTIKVSDTDGRTFFVSQILYQKVNEAITTAKMKRDRIQKYKLTLTGVEVVERQGPDGPVIDFSMKAFGPELSQVKIEPPFQFDLTTDPEIAPLWKRRAELAQMYRVCKNSKVTDPRGQLQKLVDWEKLINGSTPKDDESLLCETITPNTVKTSKSRADRLKTGQRYAASNFANIGSPDDVMTSVVECEESKDSSLSKKDPKKSQPNLRPPNPLLAKKPIFPSGASGSGQTGQSSQNVLAQSLTGISNSNNPHTQGSGASDPSRNLMIDVLSCDEEPDTSSRVPPLNDRGFSSSGDDPEPPKVNALTVVKERDLERQLAEKIKFLKDQELALRDRERKIDILDRRVKELEKSLRDKERAIKEHERQIKESVREAVKEKEKQHSEILKAAIEREQQNALNATLELKKQNEELTKQLSVVETLGNSFKQKYEDAKILLKKYTSSNADAGAKKYTEQTRVKTEPIPANNAPVAEATKIKTVPNIAMLNSKLAGMMIATQSTSATAIPSNGPAGIRNSSRDPFNAHTHNKHSTSNPPAARPPSQAHPSHKSSFENLNKMLAGGSRGVTNISESVEPKPAARRTEIKPTNVSSIVTEVEDTSIMLGKRKPNTSLPGENRLGTKIHSGIKEKPSTSGPSHGVSKYSNAAHANSGIVHVSNGHKKVESGSHTVTAPKESDKPQYAIRTSTKKPTEVKRDYLLDLQPMVSGAQKTGNPKQTSQSAPKTKDHGRDRHVEPITPEDSPQFVTQPKQTSVKKPVNSQIISDLREDSPSTLRNATKRHQNEPSEKRPVKGSAIPPERLNSNSKSTRGGESRLEGYLMTKRSKIQAEEPKLRAKSQAVQRETSCSETSYSHEMKKAKPQTQVQAQVENRKLLRNFEDPDARNIQRQSSGSVYKHQQPSRDPREQARVESRSKQFVAELPRKQREFRRSEESPDKASQRHKSSSQLLSHKMALSKSERKIPRESPPRHPHRYHKIRD